MLKKILSRKIKKFLSMKTLFVIVNLLFILSVVCLILLTTVDDVIKCILVLIAFLVFKIVENFLEEVASEKSKSIKVNKRFTHKNDETGAIEVRKEDFQQAILYLYELENQIALKR